MSRLLARAVKWWLCVTAVPYVGTHSSGREVMTSSARYDVIVVGIWWRMWWEMVLWWNWIARNLHLQTFTRQPSDTILRSWLRRCRWVWWRHQRAIDHLWFSRKLLRTILDVLLSCWWRHLLARFQWRRDLIWMLKWSRQKMEEWRWSFQLLYHLHLALASMKSRKIWDFFIVVKDLVLRDLFTSSTRNWVKIFWIHFGCCRWNREVRWRFDDLSETQTRYKMRKKNVDLYLASNIWASCRVSCRKQRVFEAKEARLLLLAHKIGWESRLRDDLVKK